MDAVKAPPEQDSAEMRQEIDNTRSAMADKLEALEDRVMDTVQNAQDTVKDSIQGAKDTVASVKRTFNIKHQIKEHPWAMVGGCFLAGLALGGLIPRGRARPSKIIGGPAPNGTFAPAAAAPQVQAPPPIRPGIFDRFHDEIDKVEGMAIGYVMGLVRDSIKESLPQMAFKIDDLMDGLTTKLGGELNQQRSP